MIGESLVLQNHYSAQQVAPLPFREFACLGRECEIRDCRGLVEMFEAVNQGPALDRHLTGIFRYAFQKRRGGQADAFLMKLDRSGQRLLLSTYYGGSGLDHAGYDGGNVAVSATGTIWMVGLTNSRDLKVLGGYHSRYGGGEQDGFLIELSPIGKLCYGSYAGSTARALLEGVAADSEKVYTRSEL